MPLINVRLIENAFAPEQKQQITRDLTEAVEGERMRGVTWCVIEEVKSGDWAIVGQPVTTGAVRALARGDLSLPSDQSAHVAKAWRDTLCARRIPT